MKLFLLIPVISLILLAGCINLGGSTPSATPNATAAASVLATNTAGTAATPSVAPALLDCAKIVSETDLKQVFGSAYSFSVEKQAQVNNQCVLYQVDESLKGVNDNRLWFGNVNVKTLGEYDKFKGAKNTAINVSEPNEVGSKSLKIDYLSAQPYVQTELLFVENSTQSVVDVYLLKLNVANKTIGAQITYGKALELAKKISANAQALK